MRVGNLVARAGLSRVNHQKSQRENLPSDVIHEKGFALWAKALKGGEQSSHEYVPVIHAVYGLGGAVNIDKHYSTGEGREEQIRAELP